MAEQQQAVRVLGERPAPANRDVLNNYWRLVEKYRATALSAVPTMLAALANVPVGDADISSLIYCRTGAAQLSGICYAMAAIMKKTDSFSGAGCALITNAAQANRQRRVLLQGFLQRRRWLQLAGPHFRQHALEHAIHPGQALGRRQRPPLARR